MAVKKNKNQKGQALFELIIFIPIFLYMIKILFDYGDAINHSINQNKVVRSYYFYTVSNDSNLPNRLFSEDYKRVGIVGPDAVFSLDAYSWSAEKTQGNVKPVGSCVKLPGFLGGEISGDECEAPSVTDEKTQFIRSYTSFGVCSGSWRNVGSSSPLYSLSWLYAASAPCLITTGM